MSVWQTTRLLTLFTILLICSCGKNNTYFDDPTITVMPGVTPEMQTPGFWISKVPHPKKLILTESQIENLNKQTSESLRLVKVSEYLPENENSIKESMELIFKSINRELYNKEGITIDDNFRKEVNDNIDYKNFALDYGIITKRVSQKNIPSNVALFRQGNKYFDRMQMSTLDMGTPVIILGSSIDKDWLFVRSAITVGWVPKNYVATTSHKEVLNWETPENFIIATKKRVEIYSNENMSSFLGWLPLGAKLPSSKDSGEFIEVSVPQRNENGKLDVIKGFVKSGKVSKGYLPYTTENLIELAFEMLHSPYGWGGMDGHQDCSGFLIQIFNAIGVILPRNSAAQGISGDIIYSKESQTNAKIALNLYGIPGATTIQFPGHIMLYLGEINGTPYAIHSMWSFEDNSDKKLIKQPARVVVSDLNLSEYSEKGAYINRITNIRIMRPH